MAYKPDQGRLARLVAFWALAILVFYGCTSLHAELMRFAPLSSPLIEGFARIPVLGLRLNGALLIAAAILAVSWWFLHRWLNRPKYADLLIETESELRKVTWPSFSEALNSSVVVIVCVAFLMAFLAGADWLLGFWSRLALVGG